MLCCRCQQEIPDTWPDGTPSPWEVWLFVASDLPCFLDDGLCCRCACARYDAWQTSPYATPLRLGRSPYPHTVATAFAAVV